MQRRILLFVTDLEIGGTPTVVRELALRLNRPPGVTVEVACLAGWGPVADELRAGGIHVAALGARSYRELLPSVRRLRALLGERRIDTVFSFLVHANVVAALAVRRVSGVRFLQSIQTVQPWPRWHWVAQRVAHRGAKRVVVPSRAIADFAARRCGIPPEKFVVIPNAVDPDAFPRVEVFTTPKVRAGYLGRLDPAKDPWVLIEALDLADSEDAELHYFGDGVLRARLQRDAELVGVGQRVFLHGTVRPQDALRRMDVLWLPSRVEGFGLVLIEAMASGVPVVACAAGGVLEVVEDQQNGLLVTDPIYGDRQFAASLKKLRDDVALRNRLIEGGLRTVRERFSWEVVLPQYRRLLELS